MKNSVSSRKRSKRSRRGIKRRRLFAVVTLVAIAIAVVAIVRGALLHAPKPPATVAAAPAPTPLRTPEPRPWTASERARVRAMLAQTLGPALGERDRASIVVLSADGQTLYSYGEHTTVAPASVQKLVVAYTSLNLLGANFRYQTMLAAEHSPANDGTLAGNLWLVGSGDPSFRRNDLDDGVRALAKAGLRRIDGRVAIDPTFIAGPEISPYWNSADAFEDFQTPVSGVSLDEDTVEFRVYGRAAGEPARIVMLPQSSAAHVYGAVTTSSAADSVIIAPEGKNAFRFSGSIPAGIEEKFWLPVHDIPHYVGSVMQAMLASSAISTVGAPIVDAAPIDSVPLWQHRSQPLPVLLKHMLFVSDNHYAEQLLRTIGADEGDAATPESGIRVETSFLRSRSIPVDGLHLVDGSGLAESNRISAATLAHILSDAQLRGGDVALYQLLPAGGRDGTLKYYDFTQAHIRAKTGHLSDADSLAGYVETKRHGLLAFAFLIDNSPGDPDSAYVHALDRLSEY